MQSELIETEVNNLLESFSNYSNEELKELLEGDQVKLENRLDELVNNSSLLKNLQAKKEYIIANNKKIAEFNLNRQSSYEEMKEYLINLNKDSLKLSESINEKIEKSRKLHDEFSFEALMVRFEVSAVKSEDDSEKIVDKFFNKGINLDEFLKDYIEKRKLAHLRRIKAERFSKLFLKNLK